MIHPITFPNLGLEFTISPVAFNLFGKDIYWYAIFIVSGILIALFLGKKDDGKYGLKWDTILDFIMIALVVGFICARIYYVVFRWDYYQNHLSEILQIWHGGIAIYGGILGALLTAYIYCKKKKISFLRLCDYCAPYLPLVQAIGRWGNFVNQEAYGAITNSFFKMGIYDVTSGGYIFVHPTFLYESLWNLLIFIVLMIWRKKDTKKGEIFYGYMFLYGVGRAVIEGLRSDSLYLFNFRISQILAIFFAIFFGILLLIERKKKKLLTKTEKYGKF